jgi:hypothetical protein
MTVANPTLPVLTEQQIQRFHAHVVRGAPDECWPWKTRSRYQSPGYGRFKVAGKILMAHRVAHYLATGADPAGQLVCHSCDNRVCCNPAHLFLGTHKDNAADCRAKGRLFIPSGENHYNAALTEDQVLQIRDVYYKGQHTLAQLASQFGIIEQTVGYVVRGQTWKDLPFDASAAKSVANAHVAASRGKNSRKRSPLTPADVRRIRQQHAGGVGPSQLSKENGVSTTTIWMIVTRQNWRDVD